MGWILLYIPSLHISFLFYGPAPLCLLPVSPFTADVSISVPFLYICQKGNNTQERRAAMKMKIDSIFVKALLNGVFALVVCALFSSLKHTDVSFAQACVAWPNIIFGIASGV